MSTEKSRMLAGELYDPNDAQLSAERARARSLCHELNSTDPTDGARRDALLTALLGRASGATINPPFYCDYGSNIELAENVYFNFNCVVLDVARISVGAHTLFGPGVQIYAASHPMDAAQRRAGLEFGRPVTIGADVWVGGGAIICPGVTVGAGTVVGAGSVVTRSLPPGVFAAGNPCRVLRTL